MYISDEAQDVCHPDGDILTATGLYLPAGWVIESPPKPCRGTEGESHAHKQTWK